MELWEVSSQATGGDITRLTHKLVAHVGQLGGEEHMSVKQTCESLGVQMHVVVRVHHRTFQCNAFNLFLFQLTQVQVLSCNARESDTEGITAGDSECGGGVQVAVRVSHLQSTYSYRTSTSSRLTQLEYTSNQTPRFLRAPLTVISSGSQIAILSITGLNVLKMFSASFCYHQLSLFSLLFCLSFVALFRYSFATRELRGARRTREIGAGVHSGSRPLSTKTLDMHLKCTSMSATTTCSSSSDENLSAHERWPFSRRSF